MKVGKLGQLLCKGISLLHSSRKKFPFNTLQLLLTKMIFLLLEKWSDYIFMSHAISTIKPIFQIFTTFFPHRMVKNDYIFSKFESILRLHIVLPTYLQDMGENWTLPLEMDGSLPKLNQVTSWPLNHFLSVPSGRKKRGRVSHNFTTRSPSESKHFDTFHFPIC